MKRVVLRPRAEIDVIEITQWYAEQGGQALAERFFDAAREAAKSIQGMPGIGSPRLGQITGIEGLRSWPLRRFPVRWFYIERADFIDVIRLLGERRFRGATRWRAHRPRLTRKIQEELMHQKTQHIGVYVGFNLCSRVWTSLLTMSFRFG